MPSRRELANAIRALSMDAVQQANSGHPGAPMGMADIAEVLWNDFLKHNPVNPNWVNRDRFVLSNGHGSMLLYSLLHLTGYDLPIEELQKFRQLHSKTPGHPEYGYAPGIETTTGPLGQGLANAVGMAIAERTLAAQFNRPGYTVVDHNTYVFMGDGCLMEGISHEVCSLAGTLGLGKLIGIYPGTKVDVAFAAPEELPAGELVRAIEQAGKGLVASCELFDLYRGESLGAGRKSLAFHVLLQSEQKTLADDDGQKFLRRVEAIAERLGAELRRE